MERCTTCNALLTKNEKVCGQCGTVTSSQPSGAMASLAEVVKLAFWASFVLLLASPFLHGGPGVLQCFLVTAALFFLWRTLSDDRVRGR